MRSIAFVLSGLRRRWCRSPPFAGPRGGLNGTESLSSPHAARTRLREPRMRCKQIRSTFQYPRVTPRPTYIQRWFAARRGRGTSLCVWLGGAMGCMAGWREGARCETLHVALGSRPLSVPASRAPRHRLAIALEDTEEALSQNDSGLAHVGALSSHEAPVLPLEHGPRRGDLAAVGALSSHGRPGSSGEPPSLLGFLSRCDVADTEGSRCLS